MRFLDQYRAHLRPAMQLSPYPSQAIGAAIRSRAPRCRLLVFGISDDSELWLALNGDGETVFCESSPDRIEAMRPRLPGARIEAMPTFGLSVATSTDLPLEALDAFPGPQELAAFTSLAALTWDVILVDAPPGDRPLDPGRAVAIHWASRLADRGTHVFVDDYERPLEERFANALLRDRRDTASCVVPASEAAPYRKLFWSMGDPTGATPEPRPVALTVATPDYARTWRFCIDAQSAYCRRHAYEHRVIDPSRSPLHPKWAKLEAAVGLLRQGRDVLLIDADAEISETCPPFMDLLASHPDRDIFCVKGISGRPNSGVMLLRAGGLALRFLEACLAHRQEPVPPEDFVTSEGENGHVIWMLKRRPYADALAELPLAWNCSDPARSEHAFIRHYTNHLRGWLERTRGA
ncbi:hypothetical protein J2X36_004206 [Methylobacterium sp. BE186]|uniref:hypothetical protein n=1 Tax=Methylobacterium sp. BE186 TaxID=2817715 RepID=UPI00285A18C5|nr:hypothetical protein [Methylobacterium sp. BE186]MDR7039430.1 hypothetical protein [Methylobacterium sp. BE186]